jgi:hypothetical protein
MFTGRGDVIDDHAHGGLQHVPAVPGAVDRARGVEVEGQLDPASVRHVELSDQLVTALHAARHGERIRGSVDHHVRPAPEKEPDLRVVPSRHVALRQPGEHAVPQLEQVVDGGGVERQRLPAAAVFAVAAVDGDAGDDQIHRLIVRRSVGEVDGDVAEVA